MTSDRSWTSSASPCGPATTVPGRCTPLSARGRAERGRAGGRGRVRGRVQVPGPDQMRPAGLDGLEGRHRARTRGAQMTEDTAGATGQLTTPETEDVLEDRKS